MKADLHVWLQGKEIRHPQNARVHRGGVFDLERSTDRPPLEPEDINLLDGSQRGLVVVEGKSLEGRRVAPSPFRDHRRAVGAWNPDLHTHARTNLRQEGLDLD
jgi:hypothetical protein